MWLFSKGGGWIGPVGSNLLTPIFRGFYRPKCLGKNKLLLRNLKRNQVVSIAEANMSNASSCSLGYKLLRT